MIDKILLPSGTVITFHPCAINLIATFSVKHCEVGPSKQISLESYNTINLFNFSVPARDAAS